MLGKITTYLFLTIVSVVVLIALYSMIQPDNVKVFNPKTQVKRAAIDSAGAVYYYTAKAEEQKAPESPTKWGEISTGIIGILTIVNLMANRETKAWRANFSKNINDKLVMVFQSLETVNDNSQKKHIDDKLKAIEFDASGWVKDDNLRIFIEGVGSRARAFTADNLTKDFDEEALEKAKMKIAARASECIGHAKSLGFDAATESAITASRCKAVRMLKTELTGLAKDRIHNSKYARFEDIMCRFLKHFLRDVIEAGR